MKFKDLEEPIETDDFWYDLTDGGYIKPNEILEYYEDVLKVESAIKVLEDFRNEAIEDGIIEEI